MRFTYSICDPSENEILFKNDKITADQAIKIAREYPWLEKLDISEKNIHANVHFSPSLNFKNENSDKEFGITAHYNPNRELEFSLWYKRVVKTKALFGLFGEKEKIVVSDAWDYLLQDTLVYLQYFLDEEYERIESLYTYSI